MTESQSQIKEIKRLLAQCSKEQRQELFQFLRKEFPIHSLEAKLNTDAELILEAIDRAQDITLRGIRGIIAELAFARNVVGKLKGWKDITPGGDHSFDFLLTDGISPLSVQVKIQRSEKQKPMIRRQGGKLYYRDEMYVVETQRTRGGKDSQTGAATRPYQFGEFDILAVSLHPSTNDWNRFLYTVGSWLLPRLEDEKLLSVYQPLPMQPNQDWTDNFLTAVSWFRSSPGKRIYGGESKVSEPLPLFSSKNKTEPKPIK